MVKEYEYEYGVDAAVLQHQNHQLVQQLEEQKHQLHALGAKLKALRDKQISYDAVLISVNRLWNQLTDILIILGLRAGAGDIALKSLDQIDHFRGSFRVLEYSISSAIS